jgi:hypothetical protein
MTRAAALGRPPERGMLGDTRSMREARDIFARVNGGRPFALSMPTFLFRRLISEDLVLMWRWLASHAMDGDAATTRALVPDPLDMQAWLRARRSGHGST